MKRLPKHLLISLLTFSVGLIAVSLWFFSNQKTVETNEPETTITIENPIAKVTVSEENADDEISSPLDKIWIEDDEFSYEGYNIKRSCQPNSNFDETCSLEITKDGRILAGHKASERDWIKYGFFNFLGKENKQLVIQHNSGGAHCCFTYFIYDLEPNFRLIFNGENYDTDEYELGENVVDLNNDGKYELIQIVETFDYFWTCHADSIFPPVVFAYDSQKGKYVVANKKFSSFVLKELGKISEKQKEDSEFYEDSEVEFEDALAHLLYLTYAGKEKEGWKFFNNHYNSKYKKKIKKEARQTLSSNSIYKSIYRN